jgi:hypothetical protein
MRVNMPAIKKWQPADILKRDPEPFLRDCLDHAHAAKQDTWRAIAMHLEDGIMREAFEKRMIKIVSDKGHVTDEQVQQVFLQLVGQHLIPQEDRYTEQLVNGMLVQDKDESVAAYGLRARMYAERLPRLPESIMCFYFVNGLRQPLRQLCARTVNGKAWDKLDDCIQFAIGRDAATTPATAAVFKRTDKRVSAPPFAPARGRGRGRGRHFSGRNNQQWYSNHGGNRPRDNGKRDRDSRCDSCGGIGHNSHVCPNNQQGGKRGRR